MRPFAFLGASAAAAVLTALLATPAHAVPISAACTAAQQTLLGHQQTLVSYQQALAQARQFGTPAQVIAAEAAVSAAQATVAQDRAAVRIQCGTVPDPTPGPDPTPNPGPVGGGILSCAQLLARGIGPNIPQGSPFYQRRLDPDRDGIACESAPVTVPPPVTTPVFRIIDGKKCHLVDGVWVPVEQPATVADPCCTQPPQVIYQAPKVVTPAPQVVTVQSPPQIIEVPSQSGSDFSQIGGFTPAGAAATGDGSLASVVVDPIPDPIAVTVSIVVDLNDEIVKIVKIPALPIS